MYQDKVRYVLISHTAGTGPSSNPIHPVQKNSVLFQKKINNRSKLFELSSVLFSQTVFSDVKEVWERMCGKAKVFQMIGAFYKTRQV